jgi:hypothetical protein
MMNQEDIFKKIGHILNELNDQYQYLAQNPQELNELELELFLANANFLTDHVHIIKKFNNAPVQKALPEHTESAEPVQETISLAVPEAEDRSLDPEVDSLQLQMHPEGFEVRTPDVHVHTAEAIVIDNAQEEVPATSLIPEKPFLEQEIFKLDNGSSTFEFILNEKPSSDRFEFEEKSIDEIFDRPLSREEEEIIALKQKLRENDSLESDLPEEDEIGPEPFLVEHPAEFEDRDEEPAIDEEQVSVPADQSKPFTSYTESAPFTPPSDEQTPVIQDQPVRVAKEELEKPLEAPFVRSAETASIQTEETPSRQSVQAHPLKPLETVPAPAAHAEFAPVQPLETDLVRPVAEPGASFVKPLETVPVKPVEEAVTSNSAPVKLTINDILSGNTQGSTHRTETSRPAVTDLKQSISLNDKLRYIRDLFNGYNLAYAEAIDLLNKMPDFKTADAFLQNNYAVKNNWSAKQETADHFYEVLNQRFPAK